MGGFAGISSLMGPFNPPIYSIPEGNDKVPQNLLDSLSTEPLLKHKVNAIEKSSDDKYWVSGDNFSEKYDYVITAAPLEQLKIKFDDITIPKRMREFLTVHIRVVHGTIAPEYFGLDKPDDLPGFILTTKESDRITHMSVHHVRSNQIPYYSISSTESLSDDQLDEIFHEWKLDLSHTWEAAYPIFKPISEIPPSRLDEGLFNLNAIESAVSTMESSAFVANNSIRWINKERRK
jgi:prenylcysteine oxidase/farnesylcysteine lyase